VAGDSGGGLGETGEGVEIGAGFGVEFAWPRCRCRWSTEPEQLLEQPELGA
jgi:hypothetical protein